MLEYIVKDVTVKFSGHFYSFYELNMIDCSHNESVSNMAFLCTSVRE